MEARKVGKEIKKLVIGGKTFESRLIIGTGKYTSFQINKKALEASGADIITVAMRRVNIENDKNQNYRLYKPKKIYFYAQYCWSLQF